MKYTDSETKFFDHIIIKSHKAFFKYHAIYMKYSVTGNFLQQYLIEHCEHLHPHFKLYLKNLCKNPLKYHKNLLLFKKFLQDLKNANLKYSQKEEFKRYIEHTDYIEEVVCFYFDFVNMWKNNEFRIQTTIQLYKNFPIRKNLFLLTNRELFQKIRYNFRNKVE